MKSIIIDLKGIQYFLNEVTSNIQKNNGDKIMHRSMRRTILCCTLAGVINPMSLTWATQNLWNKAGGFGAAGDMEISVNGIGSCVTGGGPGTQFQIRGGNCGGPVSAAQIKGTAGTFTFNTGGTYLISAAGLTNVMNVFLVAAGTYGVTLVVQGPGGLPCFIPDPCFEVTCAGGAPGSLTCSSTTLGPQPVTLN
jgi:hypothetical protein